MFQIMKLEQTCADLRNDLDSMTNRYEKLVLNMYNNFFAILALTKMADISEPLSL